MHLAGSAHYWIQVWRAQKGSSRIGADKDLTRADWLVQRAISGSSPNASSAAPSRLKGAQLLSCEQLQADAERNNVTQTFLFEIFANNTCVIIELVKNVIQWELKTKYNFFALEFSLLHLLISIRRFVTNWDAVILSIHSPYGRPHTTVLRDSENKMVGGRCCLSISV